MSINPSTYWELIITDLPRELEADCVAYLFARGCMGTQEVLDFEQPDLRYDVISVEPENFCLQAFFKPGDKEEVEVHIQHWLKLFAPSGRLRWVKKEEEDWLKEWKKHFRTFRIGNLPFVPSWRTFKGRGPKPIFIEPGMAFGTGTHSTTQFGIKLLQKLKQKRKLKGAKVIDVGAGSGILSVVADRLGASSVVAVDNDINCWRESRKMFDLNDAKNCRVTEKQTVEIKSKYDVVIANIIDGVLMDLKDDLWRMTKKEGYLVLSGILTSGASAFLKDFTDKKNFKVIETFSNKEWSAFCLRKL